MVQVVVFLSEFADFTVAYKCVLCIINVMYSYFLQYHLEASI